MNMEKLQNGIFINIYLIEMVNLISSWSSMTKPDHSKILKEINNFL